ncbi:MAG: CoA transferase [Alphaproteobacteria bacterium]|nr:CoA transferase [Alphaproteobacteria bacterium]
MKTLAHCRVLDLGIITAGAATSAILSDLGAEVIKIESPSYKDPFRRWRGQIFPGEHPDMPPFFRMTNRGKKNVAIDLKSEQGREVFLTLLTKWGLSALTGYRDGSPEISGVDYNYPDQVVAVFVASMITTAWYARQQGKGGAHLDLSQRELTSFLAGEAFLKTSAVERIGNAQDHCLYQDCYRSKDKHWIALSILKTDQQTLSVITGAQDEAELQNWIGAHEADDILAQFSSAGIVAQKVLGGDSVLQEHTKAWSRALGLARDGDLVKGVLFEDLHKTGERPTPTAHFATDTKDILMQIGGYSKDQIDALAKAGAISLPNDEKGHVA